MAEENESKESESKTILEISVNLKRTERHEENSFKKDRIFASHESSKIEIMRKNILKNHREDRMLALLDFTQQCRFDGPFGEGIFETCKFYRSRLQNARTTIELFLCDTFMI